MFNTGDYVRHARQGPGRVMEVLPDQVLVKQRSGNVLRVNLGIAEHELELCPADGFVAQLVHRDYNSEALQTHLEEVLVRILRDKRRRSIPISDVKDLLMPFLTREEKKWDSWWKSARKQFRSKVISIDTKRKVVERIDSPQAATISFDSASPAELLSAARELGPQNHDQKDADAERAASARAFALFESVLPLRQSMELLLACCYLASASTGEELDRLREWLTRQDIRALADFRDLDADTVVCLPVLAKVSGQSEQLIKLLSHPIAAVTQKAFSILNTERHRKFIRDSFLKWLASTDQSQLPGLDHYLQSDFLRYIRKQDLPMVYRKVLSLPSPSIAAQQFINRNDIVEVLLNSDSLDEKVIATILKSGFVSAPVKVKVGQSAGKLEPAGPVFVPTCVAPFDCGFSRWADE